MSANSSPWITLIAALGALGIGTIIAAGFSRWNAISSLRQHWIDALRDDLSTYLKEINAMPFRIARLTGSHGEPSTIDDYEKQQDTRNSVLLVYRRILLRLNVSEPQHVQLAEKLKDLLLIENGTTDAERIDSVVSLARQVLKHEWEVTKYGIFTPLVTRWKATRYLSNSSEN